MRLYGSFLVRCWLADDPSQERQSVLQVEHIQTGASTRAEHFSEIEPWVLEACRSVKSDVETAADPEASPKTQEIRRGANPTKRRGT